MLTTQKEPISIFNDPWEPYTDIEQYGQLTLSNVEFTTTNLCNMRVVIVLWAIHYKRKTPIYYRCH